VGPLGLPWTVFLFEPDHPRFTETRIRRSIGAAMNVLVVHAHPDPESLSRALRDAAVATLEAAGHDVRVTDLYAEGFDPAMDRAERAGYHTPGENERPVAAHLANLRWAEAVVFVYPTWWFGLPAILKGWLDRVLVPHATFTLPAETKPIRPLLSNIRWVIVVTTCGAPWWFSKFVGEPGRKTLLRAFRLICHRRCKTRYIALHRIDTRSERERTAFVDRVRRKVAVG
jgi:putative NADPH-quinone reductase